MIAIIVFIFIFAFIIIVRSSGNQNNNHEITNPSKQYLDQKNIEISKNKNDADIYFKENKDHPVWKYVTNENVNLYQMAVDGIITKANLMSVSLSSDISDSQLKIIVDHSYEFAIKTKINQKVLIISVFQFCDADPMMRQIRRGHWITESVSESMYAPPARSYYEIIKNIFQES